MNKSELLQEIAQDELMDLVEDRGDEVEAFDVENSKTVVFRITPHTQASLLERIHFGASLCSGKEREWMSHIASVLLHFEPELFFTLRHILVVGTIPDVESLSTELSLEVEDVPCSLYGIGCNAINNQCLGVSWFSESTVIVNVSAIKETVQELVDSGVVPEWEEEAETALGFWTTLLHELRHQQVDGCPYEVPWLQEWDAAEERVESWAQEQYEALRARNCI